MSRIKYFLALLIAMVFMVGCAQEKLEKKKPITIGVDVFPGWGHVFIAQEKGFFKKNGVDVEIVLTEKYLAVQDQFANNELDGAFMVYTDAIYAYSRGIDTRVVYISDYSISGDVIVAKPELKEVRDLEGKIIGIEGINSFSHMFVLSILEKHGLSEGDFFIKNVNAQDVVDELEQGDIDAGHVYGPGKFLAQQKGYSLLASAEEIEGIITDVLSFHNKIINERPGDIKAIIKSLFEAKKFQETNRKEAVAIIARAIQDTQDSVSVGIDAVKYISVEDSECLMKISCTDNCSNENSLSNTGRFIIEFYLKRGQLSFVPEFNEIIDPRFVNELAHQMKGPGTSKLLLNLCLRRKNFRKQTEKRQWQLSQEPYRIRKIQLALE